MHRIAILQRVPDALTASDSALARIRKLAGSMTPEEVQLDYQILLQARADMARGSGRVRSFTMAILRMLAFKPAGFAPGSKVPEKKSEPTREAPKHMLPTTRCRLKFRMRTCRLKSPADAAPPWADLPPQESGRGER